MDDVARVTKKPKNAERPFPWKCRHCGEVRVVPTRVDYSIEVNYDGRLVPLVARGIDIPTCQDCGEKVITMEVDDQINAALYEHLGLLTPTQIRAEIERVGVTRSEVAWQLGIDEKTLWYWMNKVQIQPRAMDNYLRVFFQFPEVRTALAAISIDSAAPIVAMPDAV